MDKLINLYYYFKEFEDKVNKDNNLKLIYENLSKNVNDSLIIKKTHVEIASDWINYISANISWIQAAIDENRQFIREDGEVLPIDKVKKINKSTITDLSKHSDYIEKIDQDGNVIPSKLYTVNKETDYGIYENRFLYLLINMLKGFVLDQLTSVDQALSSGSTVLTVKRHDVVLDSDNTLEMIYTSKRHNSKSELSQSSQKLEQKAQEIIEKLNSMLMQPLMKQMARESIISGEITKTNVLRMDEAFKHCLDLYEYITGYMKSGHIVNEEIINKVAPDLRTAVAITEILTFINENSLKDEYDEKYLNYSDIQREQKIKDLELALKDKSKENYIVDLEALVEVLKEKIIRFEDIKTLYDNLVQKQGSIIKENKELEVNTKLLKEELEKANLEYIKKLNSYIENARNLNEENIKLKADINQKSLIINKAIEDKKELSNENEMLRQNYMNKLAELDKLNESYNSLQSESEAKLKELNSRLDLLNSIISSNEIMNNTLNGDYTTKEAFDDLENQYEAFKKFFELKWKETKKQIKKDLKKGN